MSIHDKINMKANLFLNLEPQQALQLIRRNLIALAPYYKERLMLQLQHVKEAENFKSVFGSYRYIYENR